VHPKQDYAMVDLVSSQISGVVQAGDEGVRFLLVSGRPLREPISWHGPIVMNTQAEIRQALTDLRTGAFIKTNLH
jgi:redox-sensitive bicupin YhaK (pirin superfamily)